jgi:hypothetical protein
MAYQQINTIYLLSPSAHDDQVKGMRHAGINIGSETFLL